MRELSKAAAKAVVRFISNRILWLFVLLVVMFYLLFVKLFDLQIINHDSFRPTPARTRPITMPVAAVRGSIYDREGRPLAINNQAYVVKFDPSYAITNEALYELVEIFEKNDEDYVDSFPMTQTEPYAFTYPDNDSREWAEHRWKDDMTVPDPYNATAPETFIYLREQFNLDKSLTNEQARKILNFRCMIYMERMIFMEDYDPTPITFAYDVSPATVAAIEEGNAQFTGVYIEVQALREYPEGLYFSHILGYTGRINAEELENNQDKGYTQTDLIGKTGLERSMEQYLRGESGSETFEVNTAGRRVQTLSYTEPTVGRDIFLTLDAELQKKAYHTLEKYLAQELSAKITLNHRLEEPITTQEIFISIINNNNLEIDTVMDAQEGTDAYALKQYIVERLPDASAASPDSWGPIKEVLTEGVETGRVTIASLLLAMIEYGRLTDTDGTLAARLRSGNVSIQQTVIDKILALELSPQLISLEPYSGSVVITDVKNNDVLCAVGYPSYDNNRLVNNFDNEYYNKNNLYDLTNPMVNRPFSEPRAPGSTFKMVTAAAALESGVVDTSVRVYDEHTYTKTGLPYTDCWSSTSHGNINVLQAIQVSCNYFFCEVAHRMGNVQNGNTLEGIQTLNDYMEFFGLNDKTGVEIGEHYNLYDPQEDNEEVLYYKISSPEFKKHVTLSRDAFAPLTETQWYDGDTVKTAIGQAWNNYTPAIMAKYISVIANRGVRYPLHLVQTVKNSGGEVIQQYQAVPEEQNFEISDETWDILIEGMRLVTEGASGSSVGTAVPDFRDFPLRIAGKTGTAQQETYMPDHSSFGAFAPLENPQIAIYVVVPYGDSRALSHVSAQIAREMIGETLTLYREPERAAETNTLTE